MQMKHGSKIPAKNSYGQQMSNVVMKGVDCGSGSNVVGRDHYGQQTSGVHKNKEFGV